MFWVALRGKRCVHWNRKWKDLFIFSLPCLRYFLSCSFLFIHFEYYRLFFILMRSKTYQGERNSKILMLATVACCLDTCKLLFCFFVFFFVLYISFELKWENSHFCHSLASLNKHYPMNFRHFPRAHIPPPYCSSTSISLVCANK